MYNQAMSARKKSWLGIAKSFVKAIEKEQAKSRARVQATQKPVAVQPTISFSVTNEDGVEYVTGFQSMNPNVKFKSAIRSKLSFLVNFYKEHGSEFTFDDSANFVDSLIRKMFPSADAHTCPYCGVIHEFTAVRARKCPDCGNQMVVRQGRFLSKPQVEKLEAAITRYYDKSGLANQLRHNIEQIQYYANDDNYGRAFLEVAQAFQACAAIMNKKYEGGYSAWDYSWQVLNGDALEVAGINATDARSMVGNGYSDIIYARGKHCLQELKFAETDAARNKYSKIAIEQFLSYLSMLDTVGLTDWNQEDAIKNIHIAKTFGRVSDKDFQEIVTRVLENSSPKTTPQLLQNTIDKVNDFIFLDTDPDRLRQLIY